MIKSIFIVEDHEDMQVLYRVMLRKRKDIQIVSQVETAEQALEILPQLAPDLIIIDISLPGMDGISLTREIRKICPSKKILIATGHDPTAYFGEAMDAGADDFIMKGDARQVLATIVRLLDLPAVQPS